MFFPNDIIVCLEEPVWYTIGFDSSVDKQTRGFSGYGETDDENQLGHCGTPGQRAGLTAHFMVILIQNMNYLRLPYW